MKMDKLSETLGIVDPWWKDRKQRKIFAIDPGTRYMGLALFLPEAEEERVPLAANLTPEDMIIFLRALGRYDIEKTEVVVEMTASYGRQMLADVIETTMLIGRLIEAVRTSSYLQNAETYRLTRKAAMRGLCGSVTANDAQAIRAVREYFSKDPGQGGGAKPEVGVKSAPGPLYRVKHHAWQALALAVAFYELGVAHKDVTQDS